MGKGFVSSFRPKSNFLTMDILRAKFICLSRVIKRFQIPLITLANVVHCSFRCDFDAPM